MLIKIIVFIITIKNLIVYVLLGTTVVDSIKKKEKYIMIKWIYLILMIDNRRFGKLLNNFYQIRVWVHILLNSIL